MSDPVEQWLPVVGFEYGYEVSNLGRVRSIDREILCSDGRTRRLRGQPLAGGLCRGYPAVNLRRGGKTHFIYVHRLALEAFVGARPEGMCARHLDGDRLNSRLSNLVYGTYTENSLDKRVHGTDHEAAKTRCPRGHRLEAPNLVPSSLRQGSRSCLACHRARSYLNYHNRPTSQLQEVSDDYYAKINGEEAHRG